MRRKTKNNKVLNLIRSNAGRSNSFYKDVWENAGAPMKVRKMLADEWSVQFPKKVFPDDKSNLDIFLAVLYKKAFNNIKAEGGEVTERFANNYNRAIRFTGLLDNSLYECMKIKFNLNQKERHNTMATKKSASTKNESGVKTDTQQFVFCNGFKSNKTPDQIRAEIKKKFDKDISDIYFSVVVSKYNRGVYDVIGFPKPEVPYTLNRKAAVKKAAPKKAAVKKAAPKKAAVKKAAPKIKARKKVKVKTN